MKGGTILATVSLILVIVVLVVPYALVPEPPPVYREGVKDVVRSPKKIGYNLFLLANQWIILAAILFSGLTVAGIALGREPTKPSAAESQSEKTPLSAEANEILDENQKRLLDHYRVKYADRAQGVLEYHIMRIMKEDKTREQAMQELAKQHDIEWIPPPPEPEPKTKHCPQCGLVVPLDTKICPKCGKEQYYFGQT